MLPSLLLMLPIVVVDVGGDGLDPAHTRSLVGKELNVDAVAADDPRAAEATGRVEVVTKDGKLTVRYRKVDGPIERSIPVASDPARAEIDAAYLAGNLARDEASELVPAKDAPAKPAETTQPLVKWNDDERELAQLRAFLTQSANEEQSARRRAGWLEIGASVAIAAPAAYLWTVDDPSSETKLFRITASTMAAGILTIGILSVVMKGGGDLDDVAKKVREHQSKGTPAGEALADVEKDWAKRADNARSSRQMLGYVVAGSGALNVALGGLTLALSPSSDRVSGAGAPLLSTGFMMIIFGASTLISESGIESSHRLWRTIRGGDEGPRMSFGAAPLVGGGAAGSFSVTF